MEKRFIQLLFIFIFIFISAYGNTDSKESDLHISFIPPISTNGIDAAAYTNRVSLNLMVGISKNETLLTLGGLANVIMHDASGVQAAGMINYVGNDGAGIQLAGLVNIIGNNQRGLQLAGIGNVAKNVRGSQVSAIFNKAKSVTGFQLAAIVNIAEESECPIGLINLIKNGEKGIAVTYNEIGSTVVSFRSGGRYTYGILGIGYNHKIAAGSLFTEAGIGAHIICSPWIRINNEVKGGTFGGFSNVTTTTMYGSYLIQPAVRIAPNFEIFGGPSINYLFTNNMDNSHMFQESSLWKKQRDTEIHQVYAGFQFGIQYIF